MVVTAAGSVNGKNCRLADYRIAFSSITCGAKLHQLPWYLTPPKTKYPRGLRPAGI
jgi:hypothetical protein